jgi:hypothetical protein
MEITAQPSTSAAIVPRRIAGHAHHCPATRDTACPPSIDALFVHTLSATILTPHRVIHAYRSFQVFQAHSALARNRLSDHVETPFTIAVIVPRAPADWTFARLSAVNSALRDPTQYARLVYCPTTGGAAPYEL